ncbi:ubiquitin-like protein pmt3/smt3 [Euphorbia lathyris]|uniref:ubiquitin-like protein pmt3/smt3 n=1 Tax=Euphorbia lathyris TaxID=212925 RepID=UPI00331347DC
MESRTKDPDIQRLTIRVKTQDGNLRNYMINKHTLISKLLQNHCQRIDRDYRTVVFLINGERFDQKKTPAQLNLRNNAVIEAFVHMEGGGGINSSF